MPYVVVFLVLLALFWLFAWLAAVVRRRGLAGEALRGALAAHDEAFHVTAHDSAYEIRAQAERKVPVVSPGSGGAGGEPFAPRGRTARPHRPRGKLRRRFLRRRGR